MSAPGTIVDGVSEPNELENPHSIEEILKLIDPIPDDETERFVAAIYAERRESARLSLGE